MSAVVNKKKIVDFISRFSEVAKKERWISDYDTDDDSLAIRTPRLSADSRKQYVNDEFAFYLNRRGDVEGIFIEYFVSNFVAHHKDFKGVAAELKREGKEENKAIIELKRNEVKRIVPELQEVIINSLIPGKA